MKLAHTSHPTQTLRQRSLNCLLALSLALGILMPAAAKATAPSSGVPFVQALADARKVVAQHPGWIVFTAKGQSMEPQFGGTSLLLASEANFDNLRPGMLVVYRDASGDRVAHRLMERTDAGWVVKGLNNDKADPGLVTKDNLQGVIFGILNFKDGTDNQVTLAQDEQPPVAYAKTY
jgi:hypothetical protein